MKPGNRCIHWSRSCHLPNNASDTKAGGTTTRTRPQSPAFCSGNLTFHFVFKSSEFELWLVLASSHCLRPVRVMALVGRTPAYGVHFQPYLIGIIMRVNGMEIVSTNKSLQTHPSMIIAWFWPVPERLDYVGCSVPAARWVAFLHRRPQKNSCVYYRNIWRPLCGRMPFILQHWSAYGCAMETIAFNIPFE